MNATIFIRTYAGDAEWLPYLLKSCKRLEPDVPTALAFPVFDHKKILAATNGYTFAYSMPMEHHADGYIDQQWTKLHADVYCNTDYIVHLDSDCVLLHTLDHLFVNGKPIMLKTPYSAMGGDPVSAVAKKWQGITAKYVGFTPEYEYMRRQPLVYPRHVYAGCRGAMERVAGPMDEWFPKIKNKNLSEYNILGALCDKLFHDDFHWIDTSTDPLPLLVVEQGLSWGGLSKVKARWEALANGTE